MDKLVLVLILLLLSFVSLFIGVVNITITDILNMSYEENIVMIVSRIPRLISIIVAGMSMSICGLIMQQLTRNKFVSPTTAGTMDAARLGVLVSLIVFSSATLFQRTIFAFIFTFLGTLIFIKIIERIRYKDVVFVPLVGIMFGNILSSITVFIAFRMDIIQNVNSWLTGDFSSVIKGRYEIIFISIPLVIIAYIYSNRFIVAGMGEDFSKNLGLNYTKTMNLGLVIVSIITSVVLLTVGVIPFIGLIIPNITRIFLGDNLKKSLPYTAIGGAIFLLICDIFGRLIIQPFEIPISLTVGIIGGIIFLYLLLGRKING